MAFTFLFILFGMAASVSASANSPCTECNIFILAGQSNMAGRGGIVNGTWDRRTPPECRPNSRILRLNEELVWEEAREPLHEGISNCNLSSQPSGVGPGMPFSNTVLERDPLFGVIGLVPCAVGGTGIVQWGRGSCIYNRTLERVPGALLEGGVLRGMLWYQGESDTGNPTDADMYGSRLEAFFEDLRSDLLHPSLPIIQVALASGEDEEYPDGKGIVRNAQLSLSLPNVKCVDAAGLPLNDDNMHLTTDSQVRLGSVMADVFLSCFSTSYS